MNYGSLLMAKWQQTFHIFWDIFVAIYGILPFHADLIQMNSNGLVDVSDSLWSVIKIWVFHSYTSQLP